MKSIRKWGSIRTRLLVAYIGILLVGFVGLAVIAGGQISSSAQTDFDQRLKNEISLISQGMGSVIDRYADGQIQQTTMDALLQQYQSQVEGTLRLFTLQDPPAFPRNSFHRMLEVETAFRGQSILVERQNEAGDDTFYTAAPIVSDEGLWGIIQLAVPAQSLQNVIVQRWLGLGLIFALVLALALVAALWLARSIIQPLLKLRESAVHLAKGDFSHRVAEVGNDEIGQVAQAFNEMAQQVESMLEEQRAFASNTSHELRTPLTTIRLRTEALRDDTTLDAETQQQYIVEVDDEVRRLSGLISDLTLLSRLDAGRAELGSEEIDFHRFAEQLIRQITSQAQQNRIQVKLIAPPTPIAMRGSLTHFTVLFRNLLDNAIKYSPANSRIEWRIEQKDDQVISQISDNGRGIPAEHLAHVFERFYRADKARSREIPGTGLGLALVKSIVDAYRGSIRIESAGSDRGTTVYVTLPIL